MARAVMEALAIITRAFLFSMDLSHEYSTHPEQGAGSREGMDP
jgi:hypothetical protein